MMILFSVGSIGNNKSACITIEPSINRNSTNALAYSDHSPILIDGNADFMFQAVTESWSGDGTQGNPITISGYRIADEGIQCLRLWNVDLHWKVSDCLFEGGAPSEFSGIWLTNVSNGEFVNNIIRDRDAGIDTYEGVHNCVFSGNQICNNTQQGIVVLNGMFNSSITGNIFSGNLAHNIWVAGGLNDTIISDNTITGGQYGVRVNLCTRVTVQGNTFTNTSLEAVMLPLGSEIIISDNTIVGTQTGGIATCGVNSEIIENRITDAAGIGIYLASGDSVLISDNTVTNSSDYALKLSVNTSNVTITDNIFIDNNDGDCQVEDNGEDNQFSYNHYNDWLSPDANSDNIVDIAYAIDGDASNTDQFPVVDPNATTPPGGQLDLPSLLPYVAVGAVAVLLAIGVALIKRK